METIREEGDTVTSMLAYLERGARGYVTVCSPTWTSKCSEWLAARFASLHSPTSQPFIFFWSITHDLEAWVSYRTMCCFFSREGVSRGAFQSQNSTVRNFLSRSLSIVMPPFRARLTDGHLRKRHSLGSWSLFSSLFFIPCESLAYLEAWRELQCLKLSCRRGSAQNICVFIALVILSIGQAIMLLHAPIIFMRMISARQENQETFDKGCA